MILNHLAPSLRKAFPFFLLGLFAFSFALAEEKGREPWQIWETRIQPVAERFHTLEEVYLILTVENLTPRTQRLALPYLENHRWFQWIQIYRDRKLLPSKKDPDLGYRSGVIRAGERLSLLVALEKFYEGPVKGPQKGKYEVIWKGTTLGGAQIVRAEFEIDPKTKSLVDLFGIDTYVKPGETKEDLWGRLLSSPADPKWLALLRILPAEFVDASSLIRLAQMTPDVGIRREAIRTLGRLGKDEAAETLLMEFIKTQEDEPLIEQAIFTSQKLRGETS